jgi:succinyl-CoA synthetase beta subunit
MKLFEYQGKEYFRKFGIPTPKGSVVKEKDDLRNAFEAANSGSGVVVKAQVLSGGRGKAGGIKIAETIDECGGRVGEVRRLIINGQPVREILIEERIPAKEEFYLSITVASDLGRPMLLMSSKGGMNVEEITKNFPQYLGKVEIDMAYGLFDYKVRNLLSTVGLSGDLTSPLAEIAIALYKFFLNYEGVLAEINPLILDENGKLIAADARVEIDDSAVFRHPDMKKLRDIREKTSEELLRDKYQLEYVDLEGNIGLISGGAGMTMTAMDLISREGGKPACFMDCSANVSPTGYEMAIRTVSAKERVTSILVNIFGGLTRMDHVGEYLVEALKNIGHIPQPLIIRLEGTEAEKGREFIRGAGLSTCATFEEAVKTAVALGRGK